MRIIRRFLIVFIVGLRARMMRREIINIVLIERSEERTYNLILLIDVLRLRASAE